MLQKLLLFILIFFIVYIISIFKLPILAWSIEEVLHIKWFNEFVLKFKETYDKTFTDLPTKNDLKNAYNTAQSWAVEFWENFMIGVDYTKEKIDNFRNTMSWVEDTYSEVKEWYIKTKEYIDSNSWVIQDVRDTIEALSWVTEKLTQSWTLDSIKKTIDWVSWLTETFVWTWITSTWSTNSWTTLSWSLN